DESRIGMSGHSFGGLTTYLVTPLDPRIKVAVPMAPAVIGARVRLPVPPPAAPARPSLTMLGQIDSVVNNDAIRNAYAAATSAKYLVEVANAGHYAFSGACVPCAACTPPVTLDQAEAHEAVERWVLPFLKTWLAGDPDFVPFLVGGSPPGVVLSRGPRAGAGVGAQS